jgi:hypothetical protein
MMIRFFPLTLLLLASCTYRVSDQIEPLVSAPIQDRHLHALCSAFPPLTPEERATEWGKELYIARRFAEELDLYRAISTYSRAEFLLPTTNTPRALQIEYDTFFCYFLAERYQEAINYFDKSGLAHVDKGFPAHSDLLLILYECYGELDVPEKQARILEMMERSYPETAERIKVSRAIRSANLPEIASFAEGFLEDSYLTDMVSGYQVHKKSVAKAQVLNALLPGAGYLYLGQRTSAFTAFTLNGLFIAAAYHFFNRGQVPAGIITTLFESGWYFGGIYGAGLEAKYYNEKMYESQASTVLNERKLFPILMLEHAF